MMYRILTYCLLASCLLLQSCNKPKPIVWNITLSEEDKNPYGAYLSYKSLQHFFPGVEIKTLSQGFRYDNIDVRMKYPDGKSLMVLTGLQFRISDKELEQLIDFARVGNEIILFSNMLDDKLEKRLGCSKPYYSLTGDREETALIGNYTGKENIGCISLNSAPKTKYGYQGRTLQGYFKELESEEESGDGSGSEGDSEGELWKDLKEIQVDTIVSEAEAAEQLLENAQEGENESDEVYEEEKKDESLVSYVSRDHSDEEEEDNYISQYPEFLGMVKGEPNIVRYAVGEGHITLHAAPLVMSNYFLLQKNNIAYLEGLWNYFPDDITHIYWNSYLNHRAEHSDFGILWAHPATRWALSLAIIALLLYVLLEMKRRQQPIAIIKPLENTSVSFVETIGRLYYNKGNHYNLAEKMTQQFLEWVRSNYYLNTNQLDDIFIRNLAAKSGLPVEVARNLVEMTHEIRIGGIRVDEPYLYHLDNTIQRFYKNKNT